MRFKKKWLYNVYLQEVVLFIAMFILTMLHEWLQVDTLLNFINSLIYFILLYIPAQIHRFFVFPLLLKRRFLAYFSAATLLVLTGASCLFISDYYWGDPELFEKISLAKLFTYYIAITIATTITILSLFLIRQYLVELQKRSRDQFLLSEMSNKFLHAQLNPHFFFNMLNNLYGVSLTEPARTPGLIIKLSDLMRYQIENAHNSSVTLKDELLFIGNCVDLERERIGKRCDIIFHCPDNKEQLAQYQIAPLLLIVLVENAFKHSVSTVQWFVHIFIRFQDEQLEISITNSLANENLKRGSTGIGLSNLKQRLAFAYAGQYQLETRQDEHFYFTRLILQLNK